MDDSGKKKAAASAVAVVTAAGVVLGGTFASPAEIMEPGPIISEMDNDMDTGSQNDAFDEGEDEGLSKGRLTSAVRKGVGRLPVPLRAVFILPLWLLGTVLLGLGSALWGSLLSPLWAALLDWLALILVLLVLFALGAKLIAPELPLKKILSRRSFAIVFAASLLVPLLNALLPLVWEGYGRFEDIFRALFSLVCTLLPLGLFFRWNRRRLKEKERARLEREQSAEERERKTRELVRELCDSVSRPG